MQHSKKYNLILADDDEDDCIFFKDALDDLALPVSFTTVSDGVQLMKFLFDNAGNLPDILFLDPNMPRKNGFECLSEIKSNDTFKQLPVAIFSTSLDAHVVDLLYTKGATYYIRKPGDFANLKRVILEALTVQRHIDFKQPSRDKFILQY